LDSIDEFIEMVENLCKRPSMFCCDGSFLEACAFLTGYNFASDNCPLSGDGRQAFNDCVCKFYRFPRNYIWPYVMKVCNSNDDEALEALRNLLVDFCDKTRTLSYAEIFETIEPRVLEDENTEPEEVTRKLLGALLTGQRDEIEPLILEHQDAEILWQGAYPSDVASQLDEISNSYPVARISGLSSEGEVKLMTGDFPFPLAVKQIEGQWRVDASEVISMRNYLRELNAKHQGN